MEVRVPCADPECSVLAHEDGGVRVMDDIAGKPGKFGDHLLSDVALTPSTVAAPRRATLTTHVRVLWIVAVGSEH